MTVSGRAFQHEPFKALCVASVAGKFQCAFQRAPAVGVIVAEERSVPCPEGIRGTAVECVAEAHFISCVFLVYLREKLQQVVYNFRPCERIACRAERRVSEVQPVGSERHRTVSLIAVIVIPLLLLHAYLYIAVTEQFRFIFREKPAAAAFIGEHSVACAGYESHFDVVCPCSPRVAQNNAVHQLRRLCKFGLGTYVAEKRIIVSDGYFLV